jgi:hypothetical protein
MKSIDSINKEYFKNEHPRNPFFYGMLVLYLYSIFLFISILAAGFSEAIQNYNLIISFLIFFVSAIWCTYKFFILFSYKKADQYSPARILWENERKRTKEKLSKLYNKYFGWYLMPIMKLIGGGVEAAFVITGIIIVVPLIPSIILCFIDITNVISSGYVSNQIRFEKYVEETLESYCRSAVHNKFKEHVSSESNKGSFKVYHGKNWSGTFSDYKIYFAGYAPQVVNCHAKISYDSMKENLPSKAIIEFQITGPFYVPKPYNNFSSFKLSINQLNHLFPISYTILISYRDYIKQHHTLGEIIDTWSEKK